MMKHQILLLFSFVMMMMMPSMVQSHGCPSFRIASPNNDTTSSSILQTPLVPPSFTDFVNNKSVTSSFYGVYDCHVERGTEEVAVSIICNNDDCICEALYQFKPCQSCSVCGGSADTTTTTTTKSSMDANLNVNSFSADCSNVVAFETSACTVGCGFQTNQCFQSSTSTAFRRLSMSSTPLLVIIIMTTTWWTAATAANFVE